LYLYGEVSAAAVEPPTNEPVAMSVVVFEPSMAKV
jgi:hypothetical protein